jgi:hypothetical protein
VNNWFDYIWFIRLSLTNFSTIEFDIQKVQEHLEKLKETKSSGPDQMHPKFLKETAKNIAEPLTKIFQKSIETRKMPNTWKLANVTPLHVFNCKYTMEKFVEQFRFYFVIRF